MQYIFLNFLAIEAGGILSLLLRKNVSTKLLSAALLGGNLCIAIVGLQGALGTDNTLLMLISVVLGGVLGTWLGIDRAFGRFGDWLEQRAGQKDEGFGKAFATVFIIQAVGSMAIVGPVNAALKGDAGILVFKSVLDFSSSLIYGAMLGPGVLLSGPAVFIYQGAVYLLAGLLSPLMTPDVINEISAIGNLLIFALALDLLKIRSIKVADYLPAMLGPILYYVVNLLV